MTRSKQQRYSMICLSCRFGKSASTQTTETTTTTTSREEESLSSSSSPVVVIMSRTIPFWVWEDDIVFGNEYIPSLFHIDSPVKQEEFHQHLDQCMIVINDMKFISLRNVGHYCESLGFPYDDDDIVYQQVWLSLYSLLQHRRPFDMTFNVQRSLRMTIHDHPDSDPIMNHVERYTKMEYTFVPMSSSS